jgi:hypothetical protein
MPSKEVVPGASGVRLSHSFNQTVRFPRYNSCPLDSSPALGLVPSQEKSMKSTQPAFRAMLFLAVLCSVSFLSTRAWAQGNLLTNPGFERGSFSGWSVTGTSPTYGVSTAGFIIPGTNPPTPVVVHSGNYAGYALVCSFCTEDGDYLELSQTVTLVPGDIYTVAFWLGNGSTESYGNQSGVRLNGTDLNMTTFPPDVSPGYQVESGSFIATQANSTFTFHVEGSGTAPATA